MYLDLLKLHNFRCHKEIVLEFPEKPVCIYGANGAGKTSVAEALYLLLTLKTLRRNTLADVVAFKEEFFRVEAHFSDIPPFSDSVFFYRDGRTVMTNGAEVSDLAAYTHAYPVFCYSPGFETIISQEHSERRAILDRVIFYNDRNHMDRIRVYNRLLVRKRATLAGERPDLDVLEALNTAMAPLSATISAAREKLMMELMVAVQEDPIHNGIMPGIAFEISTSSMKDRDMNAEVSAGRPLYGCHRDLLYMKQDGKVIEKFRSFGQRKSCLLFMLYHIAKYVEKIRKSGIMLLLDDFEAGLDGERIGLLNELFLQSENLKRQIILTGITAPNGVISCPLVG